MTKYNFDLYFVALILGLVSFLDIAESHSTKKYKEINRSPAVKMSVNNTKNKGGSQATIRT
jgi:hypothetical protein